MNGNCYYSEGVNPTITTNKNEGNKIAIPVQLNGNALSECEDVAHSLNCTDQRKVFSEHQTKTMVGYNATLNKGGA